MHGIAHPRFALMPSIWFLLFCVLTVSLSAQQRQAVQTRSAAPAGAKLLGRMPASQQLSLAITLPLRNQDQLQALLQQLEDRASPNYHQYLSVAQFTEQFGPTPAQYDEVIAFAQSYDLTVTHTAANRMLLNVTGTVGNIEQAFRVTMQVYHHPTENRTFYAPNDEPTVDSGIPILGVSGLTNFTLPHPLIVRAPARGPHADQTGSGPGGEFYGSDIRAAYYGSGPLNGSGQAIALAELGQWNMADIETYFTTVNQPLNVPIVLELLGGTSAACPGDCDDGEEAVDIQQIISMAPGAAVLIVYEDTSGNADIDIFNAYATDNIAKQMSFSFGIGDGNAASDEQAFAEFHAQGQNFFVASGDEGANLGDGGWPGYSQNVTDVGGTDLTTATAGGAWSSETGWVGSGTGWCESSNSSTPCYQSPYDAIPSYQAPVITSQNQGSTKYRNLPDVSAEANTDNFWCSSGTCQGGIGGTSLAAPRWAGFLALANEQAAANGDTVGFLNPLVYTIGQGSDYNTAFHDITSGSNPSGSTVPPGFTGSFTALAGFDMVTGWGTPNGQGMIDALAPISTTNPYFTIEASPGTLNLTPGGAPGSATVSLTAGNGFTGTVNLSAAVLGAPDGVTASLNPTSISGSATSILTVSTTGVAPAGTLMVTVTGTSSGGIQAQPAFVTLTLPNFSLAVVPSAIYLNQGGTTSPTVGVNAQNGFNGMVNLSVSSLPSGVTGSFSPASTSSTSTLILTASAKAATVVNDYLTVNGSSGSVAPLNAPYTILSVSAATGTGGSGTPVNLTSAYNVNGIDTDGATFTSTGGLDGGGSAYSSNLLTANRILNGVQFNFGPANQLDAVYGAGQTITLPAGEFTTLQLLATGIEGNQSAQPITVTYTDNTTTQFTQSISDWYAPSDNPGESEAVAMRYREIYTGIPDNRPFNLYAYIFILNSAKTVKSVTLPNNRDVVVLAATLTAQSLGTQVNLSSEFNIAGIFANGVTFEGTGDIDGTGDTDSCTLSKGCSDAYSQQQLGLTSATSPTLTINGLVFNLGPVNTTNCDNGSPVCTSDMIDLPKSGVTISLPSNQQTSYTTLGMLGAAVNGSQTGTVTVNYTTGNPATFNQTLSDWCNFTRNPNESVAVGGIERINSDGTLSTTASCNLYSYTYALDSARTVSSIALTYTGSTASGSGAFVLALTLSGNTASAPGYILSPTPNTLSVAQGAKSTSTITVNPSGGFTGSVSLAASGLPSGITAAFSPTSATSSSTLTLTASGTAATGGPTTVTITGTSGNLTPQKTTIALTVTPPATYSLSAGTANPSSISPGSSSTATIKVTAANSYSGSVALSCSIAPVVSPAPTCSFGNTNPVTVTGTGGSATLTFTTIAASAVMLRSSILQYALWLPLPGLALLGAGSWVRAAGSRRRKLLAFFLFGSVLASLILLPGCGSSSNGAGGRTTGTPPGTYTITITGKDANGLTQSNTAPAVSVAVN